jgi:NAD kinase
VCFIFEQAFGVSFSKVLNILNRSYIDILLLQLDDCGWIGPMRHYYFLNEASLHTKSGKVLHTAQPLP